MHTRITSNRLWCPISWSNPWVFDYHWFYHPGSAQGVLFKCVLCNIIDQQLLQARSGDWLVMAGTATLVQLASWKKGWLLWNIQGRKKQIKINFSCQFHIRRLESDPQSSFMPKHSKLHRFQWISFGGSQKFIHDQTRRNKENYNEYTFYMELIIKNLYFNINSSSLHVFMLTTQKAWHRYERGTSLSVEPYGTI